MSGRRTLRLLRWLDSAASLLAAALPALAAKPEFGPDVLILDPSMPSQAIQKQIDAVYAMKQHNEFGPQRNALLFLPGSYSVDVPVGFYSEVMGPEAIRSRRRRGLGQGLKPQLVRSGWSANRKLGSLLLNYRIAQKCTQTIHAFGGHRADRERQDR
jgi:hypothetical protein